MIDLAITHIVDALNAYVNLRVGIGDRVVQGNLLDQDGKEAKGVDDKVVVSLVNVEEDRIFRSVEPYERQADDTHRKVRPEVKLNLYVLFIANLSTYSEALKALSHVIGFFQRKAYFDYAEIPGLDRRDGRITFDIQSLTFEQVNHLWGALGAKLRPAVMYKARLTVIRDDQTEAVVRPVEEIHIAGGMP